MKKITPPGPTDEIREKCGKLEIALNAPIKLKQLVNEITYQTLKKSPNYMVIIIEKDPKIKKYRSTVYVSKP